MTLMGHGLAYITASTRRINSAAFPVLLGHKHCDRVVQLKFAFTVSLQILLLLLLVSFFFFSFTLLLTSVHGLLKYPHKLSEEVQRKEFRCQHLSMKPKM